MAIKVSDRIVIDDSRNFTNVSSVFVSGANNVLTSNSAGISSASGLGAVLKYARGQLVWTLDDPNAYGTSSTPATDYFGISVAISGNYAISGAWAEDDASGNSSGKAYIYNVATGALVWTLSNPNTYGTGAFDYFGSSVAISGNYAIVGAWSEDDAGGTDSGKAYVYNVATGALIWTLNNPNSYGSSATDYFGYSVAISGNYAIVGAYGESNASGSGSGRVHVYDLNTGSLIRTFDNPSAYSTGVGDFFGFSVALSGNYAIVGAYGEDDSGGVNSGKAYIYNIMTGTLLWTINNPNYYGTSLNDSFGRSVAISGNFAVIGAPDEDDIESGSDAGKAYIFNVTTGALYTLNNPIVNTLSVTNFGYSVAISGNYAIVGAYYFSVAGGTASGKSYIFNVTTGALVWTFDNPNAYSTPANDYFGYSVAISGNYAIVGAYGEDSSGGAFDSGKAYIFSVNDIYKLKNVEQLHLNGAPEKTTNIGGSEQLLWTLNTSNYFGAQVFGSSLAVSNTYAVVGAYNTTDTNTGSGKVYVFNVKTGQHIWTLNNPNYYGSSAADYFGWSVDVDGNYAIVGASQEGDSGGSSSGKVYIYNLTTGALVWALDNPNYYGTSAVDNFGHSVAISGNYAIVGAYNEDDSGGTSSGKAYIFNITTGALVWALNNPNGYGTTLNDKFGWSVDIDGNYAIVGAPDEDIEFYNSFGRVYIFDIRTGQLIRQYTNQQYYFLSQDQFGYSVSISNNLVIVGAYGTDDFGGADFGRAYIFNFITNQLLWTLTNPNAYRFPAGDQFGKSVKIHNNYAIVGALTEDEDFSVGLNSGKAYVYNVLNGQLLFSLNNPNSYGTSAGDSFGSCVSIYDNYILVGAPDEDISGNASVGNAYVFNILQPNRPYNVPLDTNSVGGPTSSLSRSTFISDNKLLTNKLLHQSVPAGALLKTFDNPNAYGASAGDRFGSSVAISGNYLAVGAPYEGDSLDAYSGKVYIFNSSNGQLIRTLSVPDATILKYFGYSLSSYEDYLMVGSPGTGQYGKVFIYKLSSGELLWTLTNPNAYSLNDIDNFGFSVAISGNYAIVGAYTEDDIEGGDSGKAYIFNVTTGALIHTLNNPDAYDTGLNDQFGHSVAISGDYAIVGAFLEDDSGGAESGKAYIYNAITGELLRTLNNPNAYSTSAGDRFGAPVAISGNYAIVGATNEDDAGGTASGKAYVYNVAKGQLISTLSNPNYYENSLGDFFGGYIEISGNYAIISAAGEDDLSGASSGKAYIFNVTTGQLLQTLNNPSAYSTSAGDTLGWNVDISENYAIVGASQEDDAGGADSGKAYLFAIRDLTYLDRLVQMVS